MLRNGKNVGTCTTGDISDDDVVKMMIGHSISVVFPKKAEHVTERTPSLVAKDLHARAALRGLDFTLNKGEVLGIAALQGQGQEEMFECLFGLTPLTRGRAADQRKNGPPEEPARRDPCRDGVQHRIHPRGQEERRADHRDAVRENVTLPILDTLSRLGWVRRKKETAESPGSSKR